MKLKKFLRLVSKYCTENNCGPKCPFAIPQETYTDCVINNLDDGMKFIDAQQVLKGAKILAKRERRKRNAK